MKILEDIQKNEIKQAIKNYTKTLLMSRLETFIKSKYDEKKKKNENLPKARQFNQEYKKYKEDISDYLVKQINNSKEIYGIYSLFDAVRDSMFEQIFADLENDLNKNKIETQVDLEKTIIPQKIEELKKKVMNKI